MTPTDKGYILGRGLIVHASPDTCTGTTGNAGARVLQGVIGLASGYTLPFNSAAGAGSPLPFATAVFSKIAGTTANYPDLMGIVQLTPAATGGVSLSFLVTGLNASATYGIHIHQYGDITTGATSGGHLNPYGVLHSCTDPKHTGDMGNFQTDANGVLSATYVNTNATLSLNAINSIVGLAIIIHDQADPCSGSAFGNRIANAVVGVSQGALSAQAQLIGLSNNNNGQAQFYVFPGGVLVHAVLNGLTPNTRHGIHISQYGNILQPQGSFEVGGHFNPLNAVHGCLTSAHQHVGDLGNVQANGNGNVDTYIFTPFASLDQNSPAFIVGQALTITTGQDDCTTNPGGNSGAEAYAGVIGLQLNSPTISPASGSFAFGEVQAVCTFVGASGITGNITFTGNEQGGLNVYFYLAGLPANTPHAIHIHQYGDLSQGVNSAGNHFNPYNVSHGCPSTPKHHVGDMGTFHADGSGRILALFINSQATLTPNHVASVVGRSVVVHSAADDCVSSYGTKLAACAIGYTQAEQRFDPTPQPSSSLAVPASAPLSLALTLLVALVAAVGAFAGRV